MTGDISMEEKLVKILNEMAEYLNISQMGTAKQIMEVVAQIKRNSEEIA